MRSFFLKKYLRINHLKCLLWLFLLTVSCELIHAKDVIRNIVTAHNVATANNHLSFNTDSPKVKPAFTPSKNTIKHTPQKLVDFSNPAIELSYERRMGIKYATQVMFSKLLKSFFDSNVKNVRGYRVSLEEKYFIDQSARGGDYIAIEFNYLKSDYHSSIQFADSSLPINEYDYEGYFEDVLVRKRLYNFNLKIGSQFSMNGITIDGFLV